MCGGEVVVGGWGKFGRERDVWVKKCGDSMENIVKRVGIFTWGNRIFEFFRLRGGGYWEKIGRFIVLVFEIGYVINWNVGDTFRLFLGVFLEWIKKWDRSSCYRR